MIEQNLSDAKPGSTDRSLLERVQAMEPEAWERFLRLYGPLVRHWCQRVGIQRADRADLFQEIIAKVFRGIGSFVPQDGHSFRGWLLAVTTNHIRDWLRKNPSRPTATFDPQSQPGLWVEALSRLEEEESNPPPTERQAIVQRTLQYLKPEFTEQTWNAFWRTAVDGLSAPEAAAELGMKAAAVRKAKSRVLLRLRVELRDIV